MACKYGKVDVVELLLERGANPNAAGKVEKHTATQHGLSCAFLSVLSILLSAVTHLKLMELSCDPTNK